MFFTHRAAAARPVATAPPRAPTSRSAQIPSAAAASRAAATPPHHEQHRHHPAAAAHVVPPLPPLLPLYRPHYYYHHPRQPASPLRSVWRPSLLTARIGARPPLALSRPCSVRKRLFSLRFRMFVPSLSWQAFSFQYKNGSSEWRFRKGNGFPHLRHNCDEIRQRCDGVWISTTAAHATPLRCEKRETPTFCCVFLFRLSRACLGKCASVSIRGKWSPVSFFSRTVVF